MKEAEKESMLDVLMHLFENYVENPREIIRNYEKLMLELQKDGYEPQQIEKACAWLVAIMEDTETDYAALTASNSIRIYAEQETARLSSECRGMLYFLEYIGIINAVVREMIIDKALALDVEKINLEQLRWVILLVMLNETAQENLVTWLIERFTANLTQATLQ